MRYRPATASLVTVLLVGCMTAGPDYVLPEVTVPADWHAGSVAGRIAADPEVLAVWWQTLHDATLNSLIEHAIQANLELRIARAQLRQARGQRAMANNLPMATASGRATRTGADSNITELYTVTFDATWELDFFGGQQRATEAAAAELEAAEAARRDVLVSVLAEVALNYIELRTLQQRNLVAVANRDAEQRTLELVQAKFAAGAGTALDVDRAQSGLEQSRAQIHLLNQSMGRLQNHLAVLIGTPPGTLAAVLEVAAPIPEPPVHLAVGVPAEMLRRRPDVRRAERRLAAETARIGVAEAELYPKFVLNGSIGLEALSLSLSDADQRTFGIGPALQWKLFDGGRTRQRIAIQNAVQEEAMIHYEATLLRALEEVEDALIAFTEERLRSAALERAAATAARAATVAMARYEAGASSFLEVLEARRAELSAHDQARSSQGEMVLHLVRLYKALGGGWTPVPPVPATPLPETG